MKNRTLLSHWPTTTLTILPEAIGGEGGRGGSVAPPTPPQQKIGGGQSRRVLVPKNTFTDVFAIPLTLPVTSTTSDRTFSALRRLNNNPRSTMKQDRLSNWMVLCEKSKLWLWSFERSLLVPKNNAMGVEDEPPSHVWNAPPPLKLKKFWKKPSGGYL